MRTLAIGDIHGRLGLFDALLDAVGPTAEDKVVVLGDFVDRGPDTRGVIERLISLQSEGRVVVLRGNHEEMMLDAAGGGFSVDVWMSFGGDAALRSYGKGATLADVPAEHWAMLRDTCVDFHETPTHIVVHAYVNPDLPMSAQSAHTLHWMSPFDQRPHYSGKTVIGGHASIRGDRPHDFGYAICIDVKGRLTCVDVDSRRIWQVSDCGEVQNSLM